MYPGILPVVEEAVAVWREGVGLLQMTGFDLWPGVNFQISTMSK